MTMANNQNKKYRSGALGALMDEYERAAEDLKIILGSLNQEQFDYIFDPNTSDETCRSIKSIMVHVIDAGYRYANQVRIFLNFSPHVPEYQIETPTEALRMIEKVLVYTSNSVEGFWNMTNEQIEATTRNTRWGLYNIEMMFEHAIVHILRHRRQIEKSLIN